ncbi:MAG: hypothetical protein K2P94_06640 [Rhodospirillaceae bacterium]|nr:hypothetical protein [Rhodospirillaceae bacterium]
MSNITAHVNLGAGFLAAPIMSQATAIPVPRDLDGIIARTLLRARAAGRDYMSQDRAAAMAVMAVRPDLSLGQALEAVTRARDSVSI